MIALSGVPSLKDAVAGVRLAELALQQAALEDRLPGLLGPHGPVWKFVRKLTAGDISAVEDLVQDVALRAYAELDRFHDRAIGTTDDGLKAWLFTIARRLHIDTRRTAQEFAEFDETTWQTSPDTAAGVDTAALSRLVAAAVAELPARDQELIRKIVIGDENCAAVAAQTGQSHAAIRKQVSRAQKALGDAILTATGGVNPLAGYEFSEQATASFLRPYEAPTRKARGPNPDSM